MVHEGPWLFNASAPDNMYQYNSKELNADHGLNLLDYSARWYDPAVGRFTSMDPLSEDAPDWTPYRYGFNNPLIYTDPDGMFESREAAETYAKDNNIKIGKIFGLFKRNNQIVENKDGSFSIDNKNGHTSTQDFGKDEGDGKYLVELFVLDVHNF